MQILKGAEVLFVKNGRKEAVINAGQRSYVSVNDRLLCRRCLTKCALQNIWLTSATALAFAPHSFVLKPCGKWCMYIRQDYLGRCGLGPDLGSFRVFLVIRPYCL